MGGKEKQYEKDNNNSNNKKTQKRKTTAQIIWEMILQQHNSQTWNRPPKNKSKNEINEKLKGNNFFWKG